MRDKRRQTSGDREPLMTKDPPRQRRPYVRPCLVEYGSVGKLTQGNSGFFTETGGHMRTFCL